MAVQRVYLTRQSHVLTKTPVPRVKEGVPRKASLLGLLKNERLLVMRFPVYIQCLIFWHLLFRTFSISIAVTVLL